MGLVVFFVFRLGKRVIQEPILKDVLPGEAIKLKDIHYTQEDPNRKVKWILDAKEVSFSEDKSSILFHDFKLRLEPESRLYVTLTGKNGDYARESGVIKLWGNLEGVSGDGYRMTTDHILFSEKEGFLRTDAQVKISGPFFSIEGRGLLLDLEKEILKVLSDVTTIVEKGILIS